jgi:hypothetical protein
MSNLTLGGYYKVGFKRIKIENGNTVLVFYPVSRKEIEIDVPAYVNVEKYIKGLKILGKTPSWAVGMFRDRVVS